MMRLFLVLLLLANAGYWAWADGHLLAYGWGPTKQAEPERLEHQLRPEVVRVEPLASPAPQLATAPARASVPGEAALATSALASATQAAAEPGICLQVGLFDALQTEAVRTAAATLPAGSWRIDPVELPGRWMVYIGKLSDATAVANKRSEVRALGLETDRPGSDFEPGLSLGRFSSQEAAQRALTEMNRKGVRSARVVTERPASQAFMLRLPAADSALREQLQTLRPVLEGHEPKPCT